MKHLLTWADRILCLLFALILSGLGLWVTFKAPTVLSVAERRELSVSPPLTPSGLLDGTYFDGLAAALPDQFPLRDGFRRIKAVTQYYVLRQTDNNGILIRNGHAAALLRPTEKSVNVFFKRLGQLNDKHFQAIPGAHVYTTLIPDKMYFLGQASDLPLPTADYPALRERMAAEAPGTYVDIFDLLSLDDYYTTDTHWRQECILDVADCLLTAMGANATVTDSATQAVASFPFNAAAVPGEPLTPFYGVYFGQSALPLSPDAIVPVHSPVIDGAAVLRADRTSVRLEPALMYDEAKMNENDPYDVFLGGACTVTVLENLADGGTHGRTLCLFSDSFGRSLAPLLLAGYDRVVIYDARYMFPSAMFALVPPKDNTDILLAYSMATVDIAPSLETD